MHRGRSRGRVWPDITGLAGLCSAPPPQLRDSFKHSEGASETHHLNRHIIIVVAVAAICGVR